MQSNQLCGNATESTTILLTYTVSRWYFFFAKCKLRMYGSFAILRDLVGFMIKKKKKKKKGRGCGFCLRGRNLENGLSGLGTQTKDETTVFGERTCLCGSGVVLGGPTYNVNGVS